MLHPLTKKISPIYPICPIGLLKKNTQKQLYRIRRVGSDIPLAVSGVAQKTNMIMISFAVGIAQGAGKIDEAKKYVYTGLSVTAIFSFLTGLLVFLFRGQIIDLCDVADVPERNSLDFRHRFRFVF